MHRINERNYWLDPPLLPTFAEAPPARTDVLVVGSGFTGTTAAIRLRQAGFEVTVIDAKPLGTGASARNGGMVLSGLSDDLFAVIKRYGIDVARTLHRESIASVTAVERLVTEGHIDCAFRRTGFLFAACKPRHADALQRSRELLERAFGHATEWIPANRLREEIDTTVYHGALLEASDAGVHPARYSAGLIRMARQLGIYTTTDFKDLFSLKALDGIIELTGSNEVRDEIERTRPRNVRLIDHFGALGGDFPSGKGHGGSAVRRNQLHQCSDSGKAVCSTPDLRQPAHFRPDAKGRNPACRRT